MRSEEQGAKSEKRGLLRAIIVSVGRQAESIAAAACFFWLTLISAAAAQPPFTFDEIEFWVGSGANRAALAIDWVEDSADPPALVWGYRWQENATGADMLTAIVAADARLFAKLGSSGLGSELYGLGYDADDDGEFAINDGTQFNDQGIAMGARPFNPAVSIDPNDIYAEGWFMGFWHYGNASESPYHGGTWIDSLSAFNFRELSDGDWDSWAFTPTFDFAAYAENPLAATPPNVGPPLGMPGDYDGDNRVSAADYWVWKNSFGSQNDLAADGNGNLIVDAADYTVWRDHLGAGAGGFASLEHAVPEPSTGGLAVCFLVVLMFCAKRKEKVS
jgi:hypothetical protein